MNTSKNTLFQTAAGWFSAAARWIWPVLSPLYSIRSIVFGVVFLGYVQFLHPKLLDLLAIARETGLTYWGLALGLVLLSLQVWELLGIWLKLPVTQEKINQQPNPSGIAKFGAGTAQLTHLFLALVIFNNILPFFGMSRLCFNYDTRFIPCCFSTLGFIAIVIKEVLVMIFFMGPQKPKTPPDMHDPAVKTRELIGEVLLLGFSMVAFSLSWNGIVNFLDPADASDKWVTIFGSILLFSMLYPPSRLVFITEEWLVRKKPLARVINLVFFLITLLAALSEVPGLF